MCIRDSMQGMLKQVQKLQEDMQKVQEELANKTVTEDAGGGMIKATANGNKKLVKIEIDPSVITADDKEILEDLVVAAVNKALDAANKMSEEEMGKLTKGIMPPGMNLPGF
ncbi:MAG: YbaB/EbfC family nucleoid-associated protein [Ignavibacteriaceae bacterium]|nr:YbaB/EbfC family nucleoid-associated protein [Ignavibacteriaceae bacterium]